jgi:hypothetical protein
MFSKIRHFNDFKVADDPAKFKSITTYAFMNIFDIFERGVDWSNAESRIANTNTANKYALGMSKYIDRISNILCMQETLITQHNLEGPKAALNSAEEEFHKISSNPPGSPEYNKAISNLFTHILVVQDHIYGNLSNHKTYLIAGGKPKKNTYEAMTVKDLQERCKKRGIKYSGLRKAEIIKALRSKK